jgi:protein-disulfide isomerase
MLLLPMAGLLLALAAPPTYAETPTCDSLSGEQEFIAAELLATQRLYECCDGTIANCLEQNPTCSLAFRMSENVCRRVAEGQPKTRIIEALRMRARNTLARGRKAEIDLAGLSVAGEASAPITLVEYACPRCPYCARMSPKVHDAVEDGPLAGKVKLYLKTFPLRGHRGSKESGLAFLAAEELGHFWEFVSYYFAHFEEFSISRQLEWAEAVGMDREAFRKAMADPGVRDSLVEIKKEGLKNYVESTPTFFINGRKYEAELSHEELIDVLEEEFERTEGIRYRK